MKEPHFIIVGVGRSGTTLLQAMLNAHPEVAILPEIHFIRRFLFTGKLEQAGKLGYRQGILPLFKTDPYIKRLTPFLAIDQLPLSNLDGTRAIAPQLFAALLSAYQQAVHKPIIGIKEPRAIEWIPQLFALYHQTRIVHIVRDPRDVLASKLKAGWSKQKGVMRHIIVGHYQLTLATRAQSQYPHQMLTIRYEDLLTSPEKTLQMVCHFLDIPYTEAMLSFQDTAKTIVSEEEREWKANVFKPLMRHNMGKWQQELSPVWIDRIERTMAPHFAHYQYAISAPQLPRFQRLRVILLSHALNLGTHVLLKTRRQTP